MKHEAYGIRHSLADYNDIVKAMEKDPTGGIDYEHLSHNDLSKKGIEIAEGSAKNFFNKLDPEKDLLFVVSSNETRALETGKIYIAEAEKRGFEIVKHEKTGTKHAGVIGEGKIRALDTLSLNVGKVMLSSVFTPAKYMGETDLNKFPQEEKEKWIAARKIIDSDDKGSWGANFYHHSEELKKIFPELKSVKDLFDKRFKQMLRMIKWGIKKAEESGVEKNVKILAFGHENYFAYALDKYFEDHAIGDCESIGFEMDNEGNINAEFKGKKIEIS